MNLSSYQIAQMADAAGIIIFGETFAAPKDGDPIWVKQTWDRVVAAIEASLTHFPDGDVDKFTCAHIRESALCEAADWHQREASRKRACTEKNRTLRAQIATHMVSEAAIRALVNQSDVTTQAPSSRALALEEAAKIADDFFRNNRGYDSPEAHAAFTVSSEIARYIRALPTSPGASV